ncbi:MAG: hypothetical protein JWN18_187 [Parcubacteria group bacterium]|nr:hypothetical protein [Parcubacteria group bacterium]
MQATIEKLGRRMPISKEMVVSTLAMTIGILLLVSGYGFYRVEKLSTQVNTLALALASTTAIFQIALSEATSTIDIALATERQNIQDKLGEVQDQVGSVTGTVDDLQKLSSIDSQLLAKYSKVFFLSDTYAPARLVEIPATYKYIENAPLQIIPEVLPYVEKMLDAAKDDGVDIYASSAYRSFNTQSALKGQYKVTYGAGTANSFSADQGYSEHQLGTTIDFITTGTGGILEGFDKKPAYQWMVQNAYRYGFVQSYPPGNGYYIYEPWHWRFVGVKLATSLHKSGTFFYQMDQRKIDTYLISLFD